MDFYFYTTSVRHSVENAYLFSNSFGNAGRPVQLEILAGHEAAPLGLADRINTFAPQCPLTVQHAFGMSGGRIANQWRLRGAVTGGDVNWLTHQPAERGRGPGHGQRYDGPWPEFACNGHWQPPCRISLQDCCRAMTWLKCRHQRRSHTQTVSTP